jgi:hypothetical protein
MVLGFNAEIFEDGALPEAFHMILQNRQHPEPETKRRTKYPILNLAMSYRIMDAVSWDSQSATRSDRPDTGARTRPCCLRKGFISDEVI